jgi:RNA polymerase sigma-70 factor (ECF subfamily)
MRPPQKSVMAWVQLFLKRRVTSNYMRTDPDTQLMLDVKAGDQAAFQRLFDRYKKRIINYCFRFCGNSAVAEELAQETFLRVYQAAPRYRPKAKFKTWLYKIATNVSLNEVRKPIYRARMDSLDQAADDNGQGSGADPIVADECLTPDALLADRERDRLIFRAMDQLPQQQRAALLLRVHETFSYRDIGLQIGCSENQVKTLIHRGRQRMKKLMDSYWGDRHE